MSASTRLPEWRYNVRRLVAFVLVAAAVLLIMDFLGLRLCDGPECDLPTLPATAEATTNPTTSTWRAS